MTLREQLFEMMDSADLNGYDQIHTCTAEEVAVDIADYSDSMLDMEFALPIIQEWRELHKDDPRKDLDLWGNKINGGHAFGF